MTKQDQYIQWLQEKYNVKEELCDILVKDENGNPKWEKRMAKKVNSTIEDYNEYCKENNIPLEEVIPAHIIY